MLRETSRRHEFGAPGTARGVNGVENMRTVTSGRAKWLCCVLAAALVSEAYSSLNYNDYNGALKAKWDKRQDIDIVKRCEDVVGYPHLFVLWHRSPPQNNKRFMEALERSDGIDIMEVHQLQFESGAEGFRKCHLNFYTNNGCGVEPTYSAVFMSRDYLLRTKGDGPFTAVLYRFNCSDTTSQGILGLWRSLNSEYLRALKTSLRKDYSTVSKFTIHGTMNRLEAMIDIESLFGKGKYAELEAMARSGKRWDKKVSEHKGTICPTRRKRPCEEVFESSYDLEIDQQARL